VDSVTDAELRAAIEAARSCVEFNEKTHRYWQLMPDGSKRPLMGVTSILKGLAKPKLIGAAARLAAETGDPRAHEKAWGKKRDKGTDLHAVIERECRVMLGENVPEFAGMTDEQMIALARWKKWARDVEFRPILVEFRLIHRGLGYGGTSDCLGYVRGERSIIDWKGGESGIWADMHLQLTGYRLAVADMTDGQVDSEQLAGYIVNVPSNGAELSEERSPANPHAVDAFLGLINVCRWQRQCEREERAKESAA
jgi:hypothetical protein